MLGLLVDQFRLLVFAYGRLFSRAGSLAIFPRSLMEAGPRGLARCWMRVGVTAAL